mgnify:CR=1 FL=1
MSCGQMALEKLGIEVNKYFAAEIKDIAIKATKHNFPNTIHIGDVNKITYKDGVLYTENGDYEIQFDLVIFGSPCQSVSRAMKLDKRIGLEDAVRSGLFYQCNRILKEVKPKYFLMENVVMKQEDEQTISEMMGVKPIRINSSLVAAQLRDRLYWTNIPGVTVPENKNINLQDILTDGYTPQDKARCLMCNDSHGYYNGCSWTPIKRFYRWYSKCFTTMIFPSKEEFEKCLTEYNTLLGNNKPSAKLFDDYTGDTFKNMRYLWKEERARLQTVPEKYVECMSEKEAADLLGDGWTVDVIAHILKGLKDERIK